MLNSRLDFLNMELEEEVSGETSLENEIAIVGMSGKFSHTNSVHELWKELLNGTDGIREFPSERMKDVEQFVEDGKRVCKAGYLDEIDKFDYQFFNISAKEAEYMDPNQRIFLQTAYHALEDAGYAGKRVRGTNTAVFVGHSSDLNIEYYDFIRQHYKEHQDDISVPGNVKSVIASRISYFLDLKGPSLTVDTACSSSLIAVDLACKCLRNEEADMAITGGVKINLMPIQEGLDDDIGIRSKKDKTCTFDDSSDGISSGEGSVAVILKRLDKAIRDKDHIYAVIKSGAINQDGKSIGLTAPNAKAQQEVIETAWNYGKINPERIVCVEAHGTGTKLGDPIEVGALDTAFKKYTDKTQFCAIGSIKTNLGHLDHLAGLASLVKAILILNTGIIPPSINFLRPNRKINFINSAVYLNDKVRYFDVNQGDWLCAVSSFGISGTNSHIVLGQYVPNDTTTEDEKSFNIFTLSAMDEAQLKVLARKYISYLERNATALYLKKVCYTANTGRDHQNVRLAIVSNNIEELRHDLKEYVLGRSNNNVFYGSHKVATIEKAYGKNVISIMQKEKLTEESKKIIWSSTPNFNNDRLLRKLGEHYIKGGEVPFDLLYEGQEIEKTSLPCYPFKKNRCWVEEGNIEKQGNLIDRCIIKLEHIAVYSTKFSNHTHWIVNEHKVGDDYVLPGTVYLEMIVSLLREEVQEKELVLKDMVFLRPLALKEGEEREVFIIISNETDYKKFTIASWKGQQWIEHATSSVFISDKLDRMKERVLNSSQLKVLPEQVERKINIEIGKHWSRITKEIYQISENEYIAYFRIPKEYNRDRETYCLYPPAMDRAMNAINAVVGIGTYLPFSVGKMNVYEKMPSQFYSHLFVKQKGYGDATIVFDMKLYDEDGQVFVEIKDFIIKQYQNQSRNIRKAEMFHCIKWKKQELIRSVTETKIGTIMVLYDNKEEQLEILKQELISYGYKVIEVKLGESYQKISRKEYVVGSDLQDFITLITETRHEDITTIIHAGLWNRRGNITSVGELEEAKDIGTYRLLYIVRALSKCCPREKKALFLLADYAFHVNGSDEILKPETTAFFAMGKVINQEMSNVTCRCIDFPMKNDMHKLRMELQYSSDSFHSAYRNNVRYIDTLEELLLNERNDSLPLKENGTYIIAGGAGGLGQEIGKFLARKETINLVVLGRQLTPKEQSWSSYEKEVHKSKGNLIYYPCDIAKENEVKSTLSEIRAKFGTIQGVIQCAGVTGDALICNRKVEDIKAVLSPKITGTWILDHLTREDQLDFFLLFSSVTSIVGGIGQADYAIANAYQDGYSIYRNQTEKGSQTINWAAWKETGMAYRYGINEENNTFYSLTTEEALEAFHTIMKSDDRNVIVGKIHKPTLRKFIGNSLQVATACEKKTYEKTVVVEQRQSKFMDVLVTGNDEEAIVSATEKKIAMAWSEVLGVEVLNIYDNFSDLGGDSILAVKLMEKLKHIFGNDIDITTIFTYPTIYQLASYIDSKDNKEQKDFYGSNKEDDLEDLLEKLANRKISASDAVKIY